MKRIINLCLLLSFQFCYLEWPNKSMYVFQAEEDIFSKTESLKDNLASNNIIRVNYSNYTFDKFVFY